MRYDVYQTPYNDELYHYGVLGMKWGVRKDPKEAYEKSAKKLRKLETKANKNRAKASEKLKYRISKAEKRAAKYQLKSAKIKKKATRAFFPMNANKASQKMAKYDLKAARAENKAASLNKKYANAANNAAKYSAKGEKWLKQMDKVFADIPMSALNAADVSYVNEYREKHS